MNTVFAEEAKDALVKTTDRQRLAMVRHGKKLSLGHEMRLGWCGFLPFYLFWCDDCSNFAKDYPHGFIENQYLLCSHCGARHDFIPWWAPIAVFWQRLRFR